MAPTTRRWGILRFLAAYSARSQSASLALLVAALTIGVASSSFAQQTWDNGAANQNWDDPVNWTNDTLPAGANATVNTAAPGAFPVITATPTFTPVDIFVGTTNGQSGRLDQTSGTLSTGAGNWMFVGHEGGTGTYNLTGDGSLTAGALNVGAWGGNGAVGEVTVNTTGTVNLTAGGGRPFGFGDASLLIGENAGTGTLNLSNGTINSAFTSRFGHGNSTGNLNLTGGALNTTGELMIASTGDGIGNVEHTGGTNSTTGFFSIGRNGTGIYNLSGTGVVNASTDAGNAIIGNFAGANGTLNMTGGTFNVGDGDTASNFLIGEGGAGTLNVTGSTGSINVAGNLLFGLNAGGADTDATGTLNLTAGATGFSPITVGGAVNLSSPDGDFLTVDLSAYTGAFTNITLINGATSAGEFTGLFQGDSVGMDFNGNEYFIDYTIAGDVRLTTAAIILNQWDVDGGGSFNTAANWTDNVVPTDVALFAGALTEPNAPAVITVNSAASVNTVRFSNANDYILAGPAALTLTGPAIVNVVSGRHWNRGNLAGTNGVNVTGAGEFVFDGANTFSGGVTVDDATLSITKATSLPAGNGIAATNGGAIRFWGSENGFFGNGNPLDDPTDPGNGTGVATGLDPNTTMTVSGAISVDGTSFLDVNDGANVAFTGVISGGGAVTVNSDATVRVSGVNTYTGVTTVNGGTLTVANAAGLGAGDGTSATQTVIAGNENDGTLALSGGITVANELLSFGAREGEAIDEVGLSSTGANAWNGNIRGDLGGTQYNFESTSGTLTLGGTISAPDTGVRNLVFGGAGNFNVTGRITDSVVDAATGAITGASTADNVNVIKRGSGTMTVAAAANVNNDLWFGNTTVEGGTLTLTANAGSTNELFSQVTTVQAGATLNISSFGAGGDGTYDVGIGDELAGGGTYNVGSGRIALFDDNILTPGDSVGTLKVTGNVSIEPDVGGGALNYELGNMTTIGGAENDLITISGSLTTPSGAPSMSLNVRAVEGSLAAGAYRLINHGGGSTNFSAVTPQVVDAFGNVLNTRQNLTVSGATAGQVNLSVTGAAANLFWKGSPNNLWSVAGFSNFGLNSVAGANTAFLDLDNVTFGSGASNNNVVLTANVAPNSMTVNGGQSYTFSGEDINATTIAVNGGATASFANSVGGVVTVGNTGTLAGAGTFKDNVIVQAGGRLRIGGATIPLASSLRTTNGDFEIGANPPGETQVDLWSDQNTAGPNNDGQFFTQAQHEQGFNPNGSTGVFLGDGDGNVGGAQGVGGRWIYQQIGTKDAGDTYTISFDFGNTNDFAGTDRTVGVQVQIYQGAFPAAQADPDATDDMDIAAQGLTLISTNTMATTSMPGTQGLASFTGTLDVASANTTDPLWLRISNLPGAGTNNGSFLMLDNVFIDAAIGSAPGIDAETMSVLGDVSLATNSTASFNIAASGVSDLLDVEGNLNVTDGFILEVLLDGSVAASTLGAGDSWNLFDFATSSGAFDEADFILPTLTGNVAWDTSNLLVDGTLSIVSLGIAGDFNNDGVVDGSDYALWRENLGTAFNLNGNGDETGASAGIVDTADFILWRNNYGATAGAGSLLVNVPEPTSVILLSLVCCGLSATRRRR